MTVQTTSGTTPTKKISDRIKDLTSDGSPRTAQGTDILKDIMGGTQFGEAVLGDEGLGRAGSDPEIKNILARLKEQSETGLAGQEFLAQRERAMEGIGRGTAQASRRLQAMLAKSGVRGGMAGKQLMDVEMQGLQQRASTERDLFLKSAQMKREALQDYGTAKSGLTTFDLQQAAKEKSMILGAGTGFAQLGQAERTAEETSKRILEAARAQGVPVSSQGGGLLSSIGGGVVGGIGGSIIGGVVGSVGGAIGGVFCHHEDTEVEMADGSYKKIKDLKLNDEVAEGGKVTLISSMFSEYEMYEYKGEICTGSHPVFENGKWTYVENSNESIRREDMDNSIICPIETDNGIYTTKGGYISGTLDFEHSELVERGDSNNYGKNTKIYA